MAWVGVVIVAGLVAGSAEAQGGATPAPGTDTELGAAPGPRVDFGRLQADAEAAVAPGVPIEATRRRARQVAGLLELWGPGFEGSDGELRTLGAALAVDLPPVRGSWFGSDGAVAAFDEAPEVLSGRFGIVHRRVVTPAAATEGPDRAGIGPDIVVHGLGRPVRRVQLFADGRLETRADRAERRTAVLDEDHGCPGWHPGFASGELDPRDSAWRTLDDWLPTAHADAAQPAGSLTAFFVDAPLPRRRAAVSVREQVLDRGTTGFVAATTRVFDLDHDAVPDLLVWEARGDGPGHLEPTGTDDTWYRLALVNVAGRWALLGVDVFSYGCGC